MSVKVVVREGETIDDAMRRFKRGVNKRVASFSNAANAKPTLSQALRAP